MSGDRRPDAGAGTLSLRGPSPVTAAAPAVPSPGRRVGHDAERWATRLVVAAGGGAGALVAVAPSGAVVADRAMAAALVALLAAAGAAAKRWTWFVAAGAGLALAGTGPALVCGAVALAVALASTRPVRPAPPVGAAVGALSGLALLGATGPDVQGASALLAASAVLPLLLSGDRYAGRRVRRRVRRAAVAAALVVAVAGAAYGLAAVRAAPSASRGVDLLQEGMASARAGDDRRATARLSQAADAFAEAERHLGSWYAAPARVLPVLGHNARATGAMASWASTVARDGTDVALGSEVDALAVRGGRLDLGRVRALGGELDDVAEVLAAADADLAAAADGGWLLAPVSDRLGRVRAEVATARPDVELASDAARVVPAVFGGDGTSRWLVAFVTPVEARGRTGFMGNFAELTAVDGTVDMTRFGRAADLEAGGAAGPARTLSGPRDYLERWSRFRPATTWRNVTMSPHFPSVGRVMAELYPQSGGRPVQGVLAVDPLGLAALLRLTGPVAVPELPTPLDAGNAARYLLRDQYLLSPDVESRTDALESLAEATFDRLTTADLPSPGAVADALGPAVRAGHLQAWSPDAATEDLLGSLGLDGALPPVVGDSIGVVANNAVGNKIDLFLDRRLRYDVRWDPASGDVAATATVAMSNGAPSSGLPGYLIGSPLAPRVRPPAGTNRAYLSVYSPWLLGRATLDGRPVGVERQEEAGRHAYSVLVDVPPGGGRTLVLELRGRVPPGGPYVLDVATQPLARPERWSLAVDAAGERPLRAHGPAAVADGPRATARGVLDRAVARYTVAADGSPP
ncbi:MAG TPA: DUF4012 domain-containing protein [Acidimicrobiales bacterium]|nr:DUF4012 domain-containing protein [Acidimicrobiales bacterium]